jgi:hypothetical protein
LSPIIQWKTVGFKKTTEQINIRTEVFHFLPLSPVTSPLTSRLSETSDEVGTGSPEPVVLEPRFAKSPGNFTISSLN